MSEKHEYEIRILVYDETTHQFRSDISIRRIDRKSNVSWWVAKKEGFAPSENWMNDYRKWNCFHKNPDEFKGHPVFSSVEALYEFNDTGVMLVSRLRKELKDHNNVTVQDFQPLYSNIEIGDAVSAWWHIKDKNYGFVVPIQHLPVSDDLKSRLQSWRFKKGSGWMDASCCQSLKEEAHDLEEHVLWELNVRVSPEGGARPEFKSMISKQESFESVHNGIAARPSGVALE